MPNRSASFSQPGNQVDLSSNWLTNNLPKPDKAAVDGERLPKGVFRCDWKGECANRAGYEAMQTIGLTKGDEAESFKFGTARRVTESAMEWK